MPIADEIAQLLQANESADPADADGLDDNTAASRKRSFSQVLSAETSSAAIPTEKRLRMRSGVPVLSKYKGKKVGRDEVFGADEESEAGGAPCAIVSDESGDEDDGEAAKESLVGTSAGGFTISGNLEAEYDQMMAATKKKLDVMRTPSSSEVAKKAQDARCLKRQMDAWNALVEFRIHLEGALAISHQFPVGEVAAAFRQAEPSVEQKGDQAAKELSSLLGELLAMQGRLADQDALKEALVEADAQVPSGEGEARAWAVLDRRVERTLQWGLGVADDWKERTRLDARKSFKVLDQSLHMQMQAFAEVPTEKQRKKVTPPPGRHKVFGARPAAEAAGDAAGEAQAPSAAEAEIFDDREFYVQLLREVLGSGKGGLSDEAKEVQMEIQGRRAKKDQKRKEVERRASKGRKIRYVPIEKLQNFMVPRPREAGAEDELPMMEGAAEALMRSLFA